MMKITLALVVLLHLGYSANMNLNMEIRNNLISLYNCQKQGKVNFTSPSLVRGPTPEMLENASSCVSVFTKELKHLLNNMTVPRSQKHLLQELEKNLEALEGHHKVNQQTSGSEVSQQTVANCTMRHGRIVFKSYMRFLQNLNNGR